MSDVGDFVASVREFYRKTAVDQLLLLAWFTETQRKRPGFDATYMRRCFEEVGATPPDMSVYLPRLVKKRPPQLVKYNGTYKLAAPVRRSFDARLAGDLTMVVVVNTLSELPGRLRLSTEQDFLREALSCYKVRAYRAAIVMTWNLAFDHVTAWILQDVNRLDRLNEGIKKRFPKKEIIITNSEGIAELKESELIDSARTANLLDKNMTQILKEKLGRRNMAAHPSKVIVTQHQADDMITDLVSNVILKLTL